MGAESLRIEVIDEPKAFLNLKAAWEGLCDELENQITVFSSWLWYQSWWKCFSSGAKLHLFTMWQEETLIGVAPMMITKAPLHGLPVRMLGFIQDQTNQSLHNDFIVRPELRDVFLKKMVQSFFALSSRWDVVYFRNISADSDNYKALAHVLETEGNAWMQKLTLFDSPYFVPVGSWDEYFSKRTRITRKNLKNLQNNVHKSAAVSVENIRSWDKFLACKEELFEVAQHSWSEELGDSLGSAKNREFFETLAFNAAEKGWLSIWVLRLDGKMIALEFHLRAFGREHALRGNYHSGFASLSPGTFLEMEILKRIFEEEDRVKVYDFCGSFDSYKKKWTETYVPHCDMFVFKKHAYSRYLKFHEFQLVPFARRILQRAKLIP